MSGITLPLAQLTVSEEPNNNNTSENITSNLQGVLPQEKILKSDGLYLSRHGHTQKLIHWDDRDTVQTKIRFIDDDNDGDRDIFYNLGGTLYRKENHTYTPQKNYI